MTRLYKKTIAAIEKHDRELVSSLDAEGLVALCEIDLKQAEAWLEAQGGDDPPAHASEPDDATPSPPAATEPVQADEPAPVAPPTPTSVRVTGNYPDAFIPLDGRVRRTRLCRADIYSGTVAAYLWEHHRDQVEPFPPEA